MKKLWGAIVWAFERADIIPPLIVVSAWHYSGALIGRDVALVAIILGILIDLGHYRATKETIKNPDARRFCVLIVLTAMTGYYHWLWYKDIILALTVPTLIVCLALLSKWGNWEKQALHMHTTLVHDASIPTHACKQCGQQLASVHALAAHVRWNHSNGHKEKVKTNELR